MNIDKLNRLFVMNLVVRKRTTVDSYFHFPFRRCQVEDFKKRGLIATE